MYDELFEAWMREKKNREIQPLPEDFYRRLAAYIERIREEQRMLDKKTIKSVLMKMEEENVKKMAVELIKTRYEKIVQTIREETPSSSNLTDEEKKWLRESSLHFESFKKFIEKILQGKIERTKNKMKSKFVIVRILREIPEIIGADMKTYGPFKPEDIASLPEENARILIKQGAAMEVEVST